LRLNFGLGGAGAANSNGRTNIGKTPVSAVSLGCGLWIRKLNSWHYEVCYINPMSLRALILWLALLPCSIYAQGWQPVVFNPEPIILTTTGGVTYAEYRWPMGGCLSLASIGPVVRSGNNLSFDCDIELKTGVVCPQDVYIESATVVLGALPPGIYTLTTASWGSPVATNNFVATTNAVPMVQAIGFSSKGAFQVSLCGVSQVAYVLQCSTNFVDWTSLSTNYIGQAMLDTSTPAANFRFYRVEILQNITLGIAP
jgi:hypothetical protein